MIIPYSGKPHAVAWSGAKIRWGDPPKGSHADRKHLKQPAWVFDGITSDIINNYLLDNHLDQDFHIVIPMQADSATPCIAIVPHSIKRNPSGIFEPTYEDTYDPEHEIWVFHHTDGKTLFYSRDYHGVTGFQTFQAPRPPKRRFVGDSENSAENTFFPVHPRAPLVKEPSFVALPPQLLPFVSPYIPLNKDPASWRFVSWDRESRLYYIPRLMFPDGHRYEAVIPPAHAQAVEYRGMGGEPALLVAVRSQV